MVESRAVAGNNAEMSHALYPVGHSHPGKLQHVISRHGIRTGQVEPVTPVTPPVTILQPHLHWDFQGDRWQVEEMSW